MGTLTRPGRHRTEARQSIAIRVLQWIHALRIALAARPVPVPRCPRCELEWADAIRDMATRRQLSAG